MIIFGTWLSADVGMPIRCFSPVIYLPYVDASHCYLTRYVRTYCILRASNRDDSLSSACDSVIIKNAMVIIRR